MRLKSWSGRQGVCCRHRVSICRLQPGVLEDF